MDDRTRRIGENEAVFRAVNEQIESLNRGIAAISDETMHVVCECGMLRCMEQLSVTLERYEQVRADPALFFVKPGHEIPDVEDVVAEETQYFVVRKRPGGPAELAEALDPRS